MTNETLRGADPHPAKPAPSNASWGVLRRPLDLAQRLNASPYRMLYMGIASFLETILVPIAIELVVVPFMLANRHRIWAIATVTLLGCLVGAALGYGVGLAFFDSVGLRIIDAMGQQAAYAGFVDQFTENGFWAILIVGITPIPFPIAMLAAGAAGYPFLLFILACAIARGVRYFGLAGLVLIGGPSVLAWLQKGQAVAKVAGVCLAVLLVTVALMLL